MSNVIVKLCYDGLTQVIWLMVSFGLDEAL